MSETQTPETSTKTETAETKFRNELTALSGLLLGLHSSSHGWGVQKRYFLGLATKLCDVSSAANDAGFPLIAVKMATDGAQHLSNIKGYAKDNARPNERLEYPRAALQRAVEKCARTLLAVNEMINQGEYPESTHRAISYAASQFGDIKTEPDTEKELVKIWADYSKRMVDHKKREDQVNGLAKIIFNVRVAQGSKMNATTREAAQEILKKFAPEEVERAQKIAEARLDSYTLHLMD